jgi:hypothetical protein
MYTASLFAALGARLGHEQVFGFPAALGMQDVSWNGWEADVSWLAVPFLPLADTVVIHQLRDPLEFVRSVVGFRFLSDERAELDAPQVVRRNAPEVYEPATEVERGATLWRIWNERAAPHADFRYRLEDLDVELLLSLCRLVELDVGEEEAARVLDTTAKDINRRRRNESVSWEDIEPVLGEAAIRYGYERR